jgi:hypothetical protein
MSTRPSADERSHGATRERARESLGLQNAIAAFVVVALLAVPVFRLQPATIAGPGSLGQFVAISSATAGVAAFVIGRIVAAGPNGSGGSACSTSSTSRHWRSHTLSSPCSDGRSSR